MEKTSVKMNKPVYLGMSILDINKTLMYEFWYDYVKPKYNDKAKICYMDTDSATAQSSPRPIKSPSNSIRHKCEKICS